MKRKGTSSAMRRWRIILVHYKGEWLGTVEAPDAEAAIMVAIKEYEITDPERQKRLAAQPVER
jgi:hypothetical protein